MKRRIPAVLTAIVLALTLCACGGTPAADTGDSKPAEPAVEEIAAEPAADAAGTEASTEEPAAEPAEEEFSFTPQTHRICAGANSSAALLSDHTVVCNLDISPDENIEPRGDWKNWTDIVDISMNEEILAALKADGTVVWDGGRVKEYEFLTDPDYMDVINTWQDMVQVSADDMTIAALRKDGTVEATGAIWTEDMEENGGFVQISVFSALFCLRNDGTVYCCSPYQYEGQTWSYETDDWTDITQVSAGFDHVVGLKSDGTVVASGNTENGACDVDGWTDIVQVFAGRYHTFGLKADGTVVWCGETLIDGGEFNVDDWTDIVEISGSFNHTIGLKSDGTLVNTACAGLESVLPVSNINGQ